MKRLVATLAIVSILLPGIIFAQEVRGVAPHQKALSGSIHFALGTKQMDDWWEPVENHGELGILADFQPRGFPLSLAVEGLFSTGEEDVTYRGERFTLTGKTAELCIGIKKYFETGSRLYPFIGGGLAFIDAEAEVARGDIAVTVSDSNVGFWLGGGCVYVFKRFSFGGYLRYSNAEVTLLDESVEAGGVHILAIAGFLF